MDKDTDKPRLTPQDLFTPGTIADRVELMLGVLTTGVAECMALAGGAFTALTEETPAGGADPMRYPHLPAPRPAKPGTLSAWQQARSAELRDAARLTDSCARLLAGYAKVRGQFSQDFTIRRHDRRDAKTNKRQSETTFTHHFTAPRADSVTIPASPPDAGDQEDAFSKAAAAAADGNADTPATPGNGAAKT